MSRNGIEVRQDITARVLRKKARAEKNALAASRMLGIANILDGMDRVSAAQAVGMDRQTLRDWVHRYNQDGLSGLYNRPKGHPVRSLTPEQEKEIAAMVSKAPESNLVRWRCVDIKAEIEKRFGVVLHESTVGFLLHRLGFRRMSVRPVHPKNDPGAIETFKKTSPPVWRKSARTRQRQSHRVLVPRRSARRPKRHADAPVGQTRHAASCEARSTLYECLYLRGGLSGSRCRRGLGHAMRKRTIGNFHD